ncbi:MAG: putative bicarbonate transporter, IctB family [Oscillatoriophycideae cyanobacterium NC_groundwater_1537_Pr4_S-0.65um_50_18]|nr:putative bicarbonate transporter, IctB family [Oscillatoriophycideae cyanobacterium NC_groundwater_1537_Pr4_S-0.65um_50_18]
MNSIWQHLTLMNLSLPQWSHSSYLHRGVGLLKAWRKGSWLMQWADELGALLVALIFGLSPFVPNALTGVLLIACAGFWLLLTLSDEGEGDRLTPIHLLVLLYWGIATVATAMSPVRVAAFEGWTKLTLYIILFALMARVLRSPRIRSVVILVYLLVALLVSVVGLRQWFFGATALATWVDQESTLAGTTRVYSFLGNPNLLAGYILPAVIFSAAACFAWKRWLPKALALSMWVINASCLILTFSRGGWIGLVVSSFVLLMLLIYWFSRYLPRFWRIWSLPIALGVSMAVVIFAVVAVDPLRDRVMSMFAGREDSSNNFRINVWMAVIEMIRDRPILGIGPGNDAFNKVYPRYQQAGYTALSAYSIPLEIAVETGLVGLTCFLWILLVAFNQGWVQVHKLRQVANREAFWLIAAFATMMGMLFHGLVDTVWYRPQVSTLWWLMLALVASYYMPHSRTGAIEEPSPQLR